MVIKLFGLQSPSNEFLDTLNRCLTGLVQEWNGEGNKSLVILTIPATGVSGGMPVAIEIDHAVTPGRFSERAYATHVPMDMLLSQSEECGAFARTIGLAVRDLRHGKEQEPITCIVRDPMGIGGCWSYEEEVDASSLAEFPGDDEHVA